MDRLIGLDHKTIDRRSVTRAVWNTSIWPQCRTGSQIILTVPEISTNFIWTSESNGNPKMTNSVYIFHNNFNNQFYIPHRHIH